MKFEPSDIYSRLLMSDSDMDSLEIVPLGGPDGSDEPFELPNELAILPIRQTVLFPGMVIPVTVVRQKAIRLVKKIYRNSDINLRILGAVTQEKPNKEDPTAEDLYRVGTVAQILKMITLPDGNVTIIVQGRQRFEIKSIISEDPYITASVQAIDDAFVAPTKKESKALLQSLRDGAHKIMRLNPEIPQEARIALDNIESPVFLIHFLSSNINVEVADKQKLLEERNGHKQATLLLQYMMREIEMLELKREIQSKASSDIDQQQRDYFLRQQIKPEKVAGYCKSSF
jgi:ATP-dependent Lon protease